MVTMAACRADAGSLSSPILLDNVSTPAPTSPITSEFSAASLPLMTRLAPASPRMFAWDALIAPSPTVPITSPSSVPSQPVAAPFTPEVSASPMLCPVARLLPVLSAAELTIVAPTPASMPSQPATPEAVGAAATPVAPPKAVPEPMPAAPPSAPLENRP